MAVRTLISSSSTQCVLGLIVITLCTFVGVSNGFSEKQGQIEWDPFPMEPNYQASFIRMHPAFIEINKAAIAFIHAIPPKNLPWDLYRGIINGTVDITDPMLYVDHTVGFMSMFAIAVIFIIFMPITGIIFCCCRCCDRCGAHLLHREEENMTPKRLGFLVGLLVVSLMMTAGIGLSFVSNQNVSTGIRKIEPTIATNVEDLVLYVNQTVDEIDFLLDQLKNVKQLAEDKLDNVNEHVGVPVKEGLALKVEPAIYAVMELSNDAEELSQLLNHTATLINDLQSLAASLDQELTNERSSLNQTLQSTRCILNDQCSSATNLINLEKLTLSTDYNRTSIEEEMLKATEALKNNLTILAHSSQAIFDTIPARIAEEGRGQVEEIKQMLDDLYNGSIVNMVESAQYVSDEVTSGIVDSLSPTSGHQVAQAVYDGLHKAETYDQYRFYIGIAAVCIFIIIILCNYLGILFGECGRERRDHPTERGCLSNFGGTLLLAGVAFSFLFSGLLMLLTTVLFLTGGGFEKGVCHPIETKAILQEIVDYPYLLNSKERYFLGEFILGDGSQPIQAHRIIEQCEKNAAILTTANSSITETIAELLLNYTGTTFVIETVDLANFTSLDIYMEASLIDIRDTGNQINITEVQEEIAQSITRGELTDIATILKTTSENVPNNTLQDILNAHAGILDNLTETFIKPMQAKLELLEANLSSLQKRRTDLSGLINRTVKMIDTAETHVREEGPKILNKEINQFKDLMVGFLEQTADYIIAELTTDLGHCRPVANIYRSLDVVMCDYTSDSLNTLWFTLGGCVILLIPSIILAVKLSKFYRRMKYFEDFYGENDLETLPMKAYEYQSLE